MTRKVIHYRRFDPIGEAWGTETIQSLISKSLAAKGADGRTFGANFEARIFEYPADSNFSWLIHNLVVTAESAFGTLCLYSPGIWAAVIRRESQAANSADQGRPETLEEALTALEIAERPPVDGEEFLRGVAYWLAVNNHFFVIQHVSLQTKSFEQYFQQLFEAAGRVPKDEKFSLISVFDKDLIGGNLDDLQAVEIGGIVPKDGIGSTSSLRPADKGGLQVVEVDDQKSLGSERVSRFDKAAEILRTIFGSTNAEKIMNSLPAEAELEVDVRFGYRTKKRRISRAALDSLAEAARNLPEGEVRAIGKGGKQVGNDLRLSMPMPVKMVREKSSLIELDSARNQMWKVYERFVEDGKIEP